MLRVLVRHTILILAAALCGLAVISDPRAIQASVSGFEVSQQAPAGTHPEVELSNGPLRMRVFLPDPDRGFYRSTRFDWSGIISSLVYAGHEYYGPWFTRRDPATRDFVFAGDDIIAGPQSAVTGPAEEFPQPQGYTSADPGGTFVKIGVGILRKPDAARYSPFANYDLVSAGRWSVDEGVGRITFTQQLEDATTGYGYEYRKTLRLLPGEPTLIIEHSLRNTGRHPIETTQYNHNFLTIDRAPIGPDLAITVPFALRTPKPIESPVLAVRGGEITFSRPLQGEDRAYGQFEGFGSDPTDFDLRMENRRTGVGVRMTADRPLAQLAFWSIRSVMSIEPFVDVTTLPGQTTTWTYTYSYFVR